MSTTIFQKTSSEMSPGKGSALNGDAINESSMVVAISRNTDDKKKRRSEARMITPKRCFSMYRKNGFSSQESPDKVRLPLHQSLCTILVMAAKKRVNRDK